jgi:hypothetical protein
MKSAFVAGVILGFAVPAAAQDGRPMEFKFTAKDVGTLPSGWKVFETKGKKKPGEWKVIADKDGGRFPLALVKTDNPGPTFNLCVFTAADFSDVDITVAFRADGGEIDQGGGPVWRFADGDNYYIARANPLEGNFRVYVVEKGVRSKPLADAKLEIKSGAWHTLRVVHVGEKIECSLNGNKLLEATHALFKTGKVGLWTKADAATSFDGLTIKPVR